jgi:hypothetical protein
MQKIHFDSRNTLICWNFLRLLLVPAKIVFGVIIFRWEFIVNSFFSSFFTLFYIVSLASIHICLSTILWSVEMGANIGAFIYFIVLATSPHATKLFWFTCVFIFIDLLILVCTIKLMMNLYNARKLPDQ